MHYTSKWYESSIRASGFTGENMRLLRSCPLVAILLLSKKKKGD
jgi:hypothetical protein